ncbi:MAG TPA: glucose-6-phosphate dehydrogenase [Solirubrobacteraceae bacterium]|nr:glucose-6-phosphate dehydrogenase [Solirubrobacteraceae bacterium]
MTTTGLPRPSDRVLVLFGATGDLAARKLLPGLFHLHQLGLMPERFAIIGSGRHAPDDFRGLVRAALERHGPDELDGDWESFADALSFVASDAEDGEALAAAVRRAEEEISASGERLIYLSVPPTATQKMVRMLGATGLAENCSLVVEKPFGHDVDSARELNATLHDVLEEEAIYRIDHFLGKEPVQNVLALRFANGIFEPVWNRDHIAYVQIDVPEQLDIQGRAGFYEETGAFRDMVVTHLMQILGVIALEPPTRIDAESLHIERTKLFHAVRPLDPARTVFGQYEGYRDEEGVAEDSRVETFAALEVHIDSWRWSGVPFYLRTGKSLAEGRRTVTIGFHGAPLRIFGSHDPERDNVRPSEVVFELTDNPQVRIEVQAKVPGPGLALGSAALTLDIDDAFGVPGLEAYERLLHDVMCRDRLLFTRAEQIERLWEVCEPVIANPPDSQPYAPGSWGPEAALALPPDPGWRLPEAA